MWQFWQDSRENSANVPFAKRRGSLRRAPRRNRLPGYPIAPLVLWAIMSSSCRSRSILEKLAMGLSTRKYRDAVREFREADGLEKERHQLALHRSQAKWKQIMERRLDKPVLQRSFRSSLFR